MAVIKATQLGNACEEREVMTKPVKESWAQVRAEQNITTRSAAKLIAAITVLAAAALVAAGASRAKRRQR